jgi:hypothetical protein
MRSTLPFTNTRLVPVGMAILGGFMIRSNGIREVFQLFFAPFKEEEFGPSTGGFHARFDNPNIFLALRRSQLINTPPQGRR